MGTFKCPHCGKDIDQKLIATELGRIGGLATKKARGADYFKKISAMAAKKRQSKK